MNIGIVTTWFPAGAGYVSKAYRRVLEKEFRVFIYARGGKTMKCDPLWDDENVTWGPYHYNGIRISHFLNWLKKKKIDVVFFNEQRFWKPVIEAKRLGVITGAYVDYYKQSTVKAFEIYDFLICNTKRHFSVFNWHSNAYYVPWGTEVSKFQKAKPNNRKLTFLISVGWQGKYDGDRRGSLLATKAFTKVVGDCKLLVYSQIGLGNCLPIWRTLVSEDSRITFIQGTFDPFPYSEGDVFLYPSKLDGIGLTLPEALSNGLPAITTNNPPMNEFVENGVNGFLVDVEKFLGREDGYYWAESHCEINSLTEKMQIFVDNGIDFLLEFKNRTYNQAVKKLDWNINSEVILEIFNSQIGRSRTLDNKLYSYAKLLDNQQSPSFSYKFFSLFKNYFFFLMIGNGDSLYRTNITNKLIQKIKRVRAKFNMV